MEEDKLLMIPLICKENSDAKFIKIIKWLVIIIIVSNLFWGATWFTYWLMPTEVQTITQDCNDNGICNFVGNDGDIDYGSTPIN